MPAPVRLFNGEWDKLNITEVADGDGPIADTELPGRPLCDFAV